MISGRSLVRTASEAPQSLGPQVAHAAPSFPECGCTHSFSSAQAPTAWGFFCPGRECRNAQRSSVLRLG